MRLCAFAGNFRPKLEFTIMSFDKFLTKVFGSSNQRFLKTIGPTVNEVNAHEPAMQKLSDDELRARTAIFKEKVQRGRGRHHRQRPAQSPRKRDS